MASHQTSKNTSRSKGVKPPKHPKNEALDDYPDEGIDTYAALEDELTISSDRAVVSTKRAKKKRQGNARREKERREQEQREHTTAVIRRLEIRLVVVNAVRVVRQLMHSIEWTEEQKVWLERDLYGDVEWAPEELAEVRLDLWGDA